MGINLYTHRHRRLNKYSQFGEEIALSYLVDNLRVVPPITVEFGAGDGVFRSNTKLLSERSGWIRYLFDVNPEAPDVVKAFINRENIVPLFRDHKIPKSLGVLSIDIDGNDFYVTEALFMAGWRPRVIIIEFNQAFHQHESFVFPYDPDYKWDTYNLNYGASYEAFRRMLSLFGYVIVARVACNLIAVSEADQMEINHLCDPVQYRPHRHHTGPLTKRQFQPYPVPSLAQHLKANVGQFSYSQSGEDRVFDYLVRHMVDVPRVCVEFGVLENERHSNTKSLRERLQWTPYLFDSSLRQVPNLVQATITRENVCSVFTAAAVPSSLGLLSIDIDGNDVYVADALFQGGWRSRILSMEFNPGFFPDEALIQPYNPDFHWSEGPNWGASYLAMTRFLGKWGYSPVITVGLNIISVLTADYTALQPLVGTPTYRVTGKHGGPKRDLFIPYE